MTIQAACTHWCNSGQSFRLDLRPATQEGIHICYCKPGQKPVVREAIRPSVESTAVVLLTGDDALASETCLLNIGLCPHRLVLPSAVVRDACFLSPQRMLEDP